MTNRPYLLLACILCMASGCPGEIHDDDDTAGDDDATADDDDTGDDDDTTPDEPCAQVGQGGFWFDASPAGSSEMIMEGELNWDGQYLSVAPDFGPAFALTIDHDPAVFDLDVLMDGIHGPGRFYLVALAQGAWTSHGVLAAATADGAHTVVLGTAEFPGLATDVLGTTLWVEASEDECPDGLVDMQGCGLGAALPLEVLFGGVDPPATLVWPGESVDLGGFTFRHHHGYEVFEVLCDDFDARYVQWSLVQE
jgi:hypothetical protein